MHTRKLTRSALAVVTAVGMGMALLPSTAVAQDRPEVNPVGTKHTVTKTAYPEDTLALRIRFATDTGLYYEGADVDKAFDGAKIVVGAPPLPPEQEQMVQSLDPAMREEILAAVSGPMGVWPLVSQKKDGNKVTLDYAGSVNFMAYCRDEAGEGRPEWRGFCQDDVTYSDPQVVVDTETGEGDISFAVYYRNKDNGMFVGPVRQKLMELSSPFPGGLHTVPMVSDGIATVSPAYLKYTDANKNLLPFVSAPVGGFSFAADGVPDTPGPVKPKPFVIGKYGTNNGVDFSYGDTPATFGAPVSSQAPVFTSADGSLADKPAGTKFSLVPTAVIAEDYSGHGLKPTYIRGEIPGMSVDPDTGVVTYTADEKQARFSQASTLRGVVQATYPDGSTDVAEVVFSLPPRPGNPGTFTPGDGEPEPGKDRNAFTQELTLDRFGGLDGNGTRVIDDGVDTSAKIVASGKGLIYGFNNSMGILYATPEGYRMGFFASGMDRNARFATIAQQSESFLATKNKLYALFSKSQEPRAIYDAEGTITGLNSANDGTSVSMVVRRDDGSAQFVTFGTWFPDFTYQPQDSFNLPSPSQLFGKEATNDVWGVNKTEGIGDDLYQLSDGNWLWINDQPLADGTSSVTPILIDPVAKTATKLKGFDEQFAGVRGRADALHAAVSGDNLVVFNQVDSQAGGGSAGQENQNIGFYVYDPATKSFTAKGPAGAINGVGPVVSATFDENGRPVFVDSQNYLTIVDPETRQVVQGGKPFHGLERLASNNRKLLVRKGSFYHTVGENADKFVVFESAQPAAGVVAKAPEKPESELYVPSVAAAKNPAVIGASVTTAPVMFTADNDSTSTVDAPRGVTFRAGDGVDPSKVSVNTDTGAVTVTPSFSDGVSGVVKVPVTVAYADGSTGSVDVSVPVAPPADSDVVSVAYSRVDGDVKAGATLSSRPTLTSLDGATVAVADANIASFTRGGGVDSRFSVAADTGEVSFTVTAADLAKGRVDVPVVVKFRDGSSSKVAAEFVVKKQKPAPLDTPQRGDDGSSASGQSEDHAGSADDGGVIAGIIVVLAAVGAVVAAVGSGVVKLPTIPGLPPIPGVAGQQ